MFRHQVDHAPKVDRRFGAVTQLDQLRAQIDQVHHLLSYRTGPQRPALAGVLAEASTLAGWQALDRTALGQAWTHYERAKTAAREADSPALLAHAIAEQSFVLIDLDETLAAVDQLAHARSIAHGTATPPCKPGSPPRTARPSRPPATPTTHGAPSTPLLACSRPTPSTPRCRSCSSPTRTSTAGAATRWPASAHQRPPTNSPQPSPACQRTSSARVLVYWSISPTLTPPLVTVTPPSLTPSRPVASLRRSNPTGTNGG